MLRPEDPKSESLLHCNRYWNPNSNDEVYMLIKKSEENRKLIGLLHSQEQIGKDQSD